MRPSHPALSLVHPGLSFAFLRGGAKQTAPTRTSDPRQRTTLAPNRTPARVLLQQSPSSGQPPPTTKKRERSHHLSRFLHSVLQYSPFTHTVAHRTLLGGRGALACAKSTEPRSSQRRRRGETRNIRFGPTRHKSQSKLIYRPSEARARVALISPSQTSPLLRTPLSSKRVPAPRKPTSR